ncbi:MAG: hypothetical protein ACRBHB_16255 [Arenicella sp.]
MTSSVRSCFNLPDEFDAYDSPYEILTSDYLSEHAKERVRYMLDYFESLSKTGCYLDAYYTAPQLKALSCVFSILMCAEESASLTFYRQAKQELDNDVRHAFCEIAAEEYVHDQLLKFLFTALPITAESKHAARRARGTFLRMISPNPGEHFARIAALDSTAVVILTAIIKSPVNLHVEPIQKLARFIRKDEGKHIRTALKYSRKLKTPSSVIDDAFGTARSLLIDTLRPDEMIYRELGLSTDDLIQNTGSDDLSNIYASG